MDIKETLKSGKMSIEELTKQFEKEIAQAQKEIEQEQKEQKEKDEVAEAIAELREEAILSLIDYLTMAGIIEAFESDEDDDELFETIEELFIAVEEAYGDTSETTVEINTKVFDPGRLFAKFFLPW